MKLLQGEALAQVLNASFALRALAWERHALAAEQVFERLRGLAAHGLGFAPLHVVGDLLCLCRHGFQARFRSDDGPIWSEAERSVCLRYEREWLARLQQQPFLQELAEGLGADPLGEQRLDRLILRLLQRLQPCFQPAWRMLPTALNALDWRPDDGEAAGAVEAIAGLLADMAQALDRLGEQFRWSTLLTPEDVFEITHIDALSSDALRLGCRQLIQCVHALRPVDPTRFHLAPEHADADTRWVDETHYPSGGLAGLTTRGPFENLVGSELAYLEDADAAVNLFDLRYVEGELLFYLRDDGVMRRWRRAVHLVLDLGELFSIKAMNYPWQYGILVQGFCLRLMDDLFQLFEHDAVEAHFHYCGTHDPDVLTAAMGVLRLLLRDPIHQARVHLHRHEGRLPAGLLAARRKAYVLVFCHDAVAAWQRFLAQDFPALETALVVPVGGPGAERIALPATGGGLDDLRTMKAALLHTLVGRHGVIGNPPSGRVPPG